MSKSESKNLKTMLFGGRTNKASCKQVVREVNGAEINIGIVEGYIATWDVDRGNGWYKDQFKRGAFLDSIQRHINSNNRPIRFKDHHGKTVGGWPIENVREDDKGLFGIAEINLDVTEGFEAYKLAQQGVLSDFSIGFGTQAYSWEEIDGEEVRIITKAEVWEGSIVDEPMNPFASMTAVKSLKEVEEIGTIREYEQLLVDNCFSKKVAKAIISGIKNAQPVEGCDDLSETEGKEKNEREAQDAKNLKIAEDIKMNMLLNDIKSNLGG